MRPAEISNEEIFDAGKKLRSTGKKNITGYALRGILGAGDPKRLKLVWDEYDNENKTEETPDLRLPAELEDIVAELEKYLTEQVRPLTNRLYEGSLRAAQKQVSESSRELKQVKAAAEAEMTDANAIIDGLEQRLADTEHELQKTKDELKLSQDDRDKYERNAIELGAEVKHLRDNSTFEEMMKRIVALENERGKS